MEKLIRTRYTPKFGKWFKRKANEEIRKRTLQTIGILRDGIKESQGGRPRYGRSKILRGVEEPICEINVTGDLRLLYYILNRNNEIDLLIIAVSDHDYLNREANHSAEHLVHARQMDFLAWDDEDSITAEFPHSPYKNKHDKYIGQEEYDKLNATKKMQFKKLDSKSTNLAFDDFIQENLQYYGGENDDSWSKEKLEKGFDDACIWELTPHLDKDGNPIHSKMYEDGELAPKLALKPQQIKLLEINTPIFILEGVAGTGKTTLLEERFIIFAENNDWKNETLFLTHNPELAKAVKSRLKQRFNQQDHSFIDDTVMDTESYYRSIEKEYIMNNYNQKQEKLISESKKEIKSLEKELNELNNKIVDQEVRIKNISEKEIPHAKVKISYLKSDKKTKKSRSKINNTMTIQDALEGKNVQKNSENTINERSIGLKKNKLHKKLTEL